MAGEELGKGRVERREHHLLQLKTATVEELHENQGMHSSRLFIACSSKNSMLVGTGRSSKVAEKVGGIG